jgi:hypothetical protein
MEVLMEAHALVLALMVLIPAGLDTSRGIKAPFLTPLANLRVLC